MSSAELQSYGGINEPASIVKQSSGRASTHKCMTVFFRFPSTSSILKVLVGTRLEQKTFAQGAAQWDQTRNRVVGKQASYHRPTPLTMLKIYKQQQC